MKVCIHIEPVRPRPCGRPCYQLHDIHKNVNSNHSCKLYVRAHSILKRGGISATALIQLLYDSTLIHHPP